jgi:hypothetical protein
MFFEKKSNMTRNPPVLTRNPAIFLNSQNQGFFYCDVIPNTRICKFSDSEKKIKLEVVGIKKIKYPIKVHHTKPFMLRFCTP